MIFGREPAALIGSIVTVVGLILAAFVGQGFLSGAAAGRIKDIVVAGAQLVLALLPLITGLLIRQNVTPSAAPKLTAGTPVIVTNVDGERIGTDRVAAA